MTDKPIITETPPDIGSGNQPHFNVAEFNQAIFDKGYDSYIERALRCPCVQLNNGQALSDCLNCGATGWIFVEKRQTVIIAQSMSLNKKYEAWTEQTVGNVVLTVRATDKLGYMDKVTLIDLEAWHSQVLKPIKYKGNTFAFTTYLPKEVLDIYQFIASDKPLIPLVNSDDYIVDGNKVVFKGKVKDYPTLSVTIRYSHAPTYYVIDINRDLIQQKSQEGCSTEEKNYPLRAVARRAHFVLDAPNFSGDRVFDNTVYP